MFANCIYHFTNVTVIPEASPQRKSQIWDGERNFELDCYSDQMDLGHEFVYHVDFPVLRFCVLVEMLKWKTALFDTKKSWCRYNVYRTGTPQLPMQVLCKLGKSPPTLLYFLPLSSSLLAGEIKTSRIPIIQIYLCLNTTMWLQ